MTTPTRFFSVPALIELDELSDVELATIDEATYRPHPGQEMGALHPVVWTRAVGKGRMVYVALGHTPESYGDPNLTRIIANAMRWVARR